MFGLALPSRPMRLRRIPNAEQSGVSRWCDADQFPKSRREGACLLEPGFEGDLGDGHSRGHQHRLGTFDTTDFVVPMRRNPEGLLEGSAEMIAAKAGKLGQRVKWDIVGEMFFNIGGNDPLLPGREFLRVPDARSGWIRNRDAALPAPEHGRALPNMGDFVVVDLRQPSPV